MGNEVVIITGVRSVSPPPPCTQKHDRDLIAFSFCFILTHIPLFKKPESQLFVETRLQAILSSGSPAASPLISAP